MTPRTPVEAWRKNLYVMWLSLFIAMMGMSLVVPFLPFFVRSLGVTAPEQVARWSGLVFAGPFFLSFVLTPVWGMLGDRYGRKLMVVRAIFGLAVSQALIGFSQNVEMLFLFRMVQGAISGFIASALALVAASAPHDRSGYAIGLLHSAIAAGNVIGPLVGGGLADAFGYRPIFFIVATLCAVAGILVITLVREEKRWIRKEARGPTLLSNYLYAFRSRRIRIALAAIFLAQVSVFIVQPIFALYVEELAPRTAYIATLAGGVFSVAGVFMVIGGPWWGKRNDLRSYRMNLMLATAGAATAYIAQGLATEVYHLIPFRALQGFCVGGMLPTLYSYVSKNTEMARRGGIMGIASSAHLLANMAGPTAGGLLAAQFGLRQSFFITGGALLLAVVFIRAFFVDMRGSENPYAEADENDPQTIPVEARE